MKNPLFRLESYFSVKETLPRGPAIIQFWGPRLGEVCVEMGIYWDLEFLNVFNVVPSCSHQVPMVI
jgi:hypothetical protein